MQDKHRSTTSVSVRYTCCVLSLLFGLLLSVADNGTADTHKPVYTFGVFPYLPSAQLEDIYAPIGAALGRALACDIRFRTSFTFATFAENLRAQRYDIAFVQPFDYVTIATAAGYVPRARRDVMLSGLMVVPQESPIQSLQDLRVKTLTLPPLNAAVSHLAKMALSRVGLNPERDVTLRHVPSHTACLNQLVIEKAQACVTASPPLHLFQQRKRRQFRTLAKTPAIPSPLFVAHTRVPEHHRAVLQETMVSWHQSDSGRQ